jgi:Holliday junction resolvase
LSRAKQKGTSAETAVVNYLNENGFNVERRALQGSKDRGDINGVPNTVIEVKAGKNYRIPEWLKETEQERLNDEAALGVLVVKPVGKGVGSVEDWWAIVPLSTIVTLIKETGHAERLRP